MEYFSNDVPKNSGGLGPRFDFSSLFNHAFDLFKRSFGWQVLAMVLLAVTYFIVSAVVNSIFGVNQVVLSSQINAMKNPTAEEILQTIMDGTGMMQSLVITPIFNSLLFPLYAAFPYLMHKANTNQAINFSDIFIGYQKNFGQFFLLGLLSMLINYISLVMCVIPFFLVIPLWYTAICFVLFENKNAVDALKSSFALGKLNYGTLLGFSLVALLFAIGGIFLCCIGVLGTLPFFYAASYSPYVADRGVPTGV